MVMQENEKQNNKKILIACYQRPFSKKSLQKIKQILEQKQPDEVLVLSIAEQRKSSGTIESYLGRKDIQKLKNQYEKDQEIRSTGYADKILNISKDFNISSRKIKKKGNISKIINNTIRQYQPDSVIINHSDKSKLDKIMTGCVEDAIDQECDNIIVV